MDTEKYTIKKPALPVVAWALGGAMLAGLIALWIAAQAAFAQVMTYEHAVASATVVEVSAIAEALALVRARRRQDYALPALGLVLGLLVSGTYNYIQAQQAGRAVGLVDSWQLFTLALGPLAATVTLALNFGLALRDWEIARAKWDTDYQAWLDGRAATARAEAAAKADRDAKHAEKIETIRAKFSFQNAKTSQPSHDDSHTDAPVEKPTAPPRAEWVKQYMLDHAPVSRATAYRKYAELWGGK